MKIVFLDADSIGRDIDLSYYNQLGEVVVYGHSDDSIIHERVVDADVVIVNKAEVNENTFGDVKNLKLVCVSATGTNNLDKDWLDKNNIAWRNVAGYSTESVAQHTFALLFFLWEKMHYYDEHVKSERVINDTMFTHFAKTFYELKDKTWGIIGLGNIGRRVADIAKMFGCNVIYYSTSHAAPQEGYHQVSFDELLSTSDIVSVHAPLTGNTLNLMDYSAFSKMKSSSIFINVGRGPIVVEADLAKALNENLIAGAGLDVLCKEPMTSDNPLKEIKDSCRLVITPHIAWAAVEARTRLMEIIYNQIKEFFGI